MAHKLIPKRDLPDDFHSKKERGKRTRHSEGKILMLKSSKGHEERGCCTVGKSKMKQGEEKVLRALALIEIFSSILSGRAGVSVMPNGVIKGINLRQDLICCTHHGIFIRYHHSVMNLLITSGKYCVVGVRQELQSRRTSWKVPVT